MASVRYILDRSADDNPAVGTRQSFADPFCPISSIGTGHTIMPVENEQVMHVYEMHHVMAHLPSESRHLFKLNIWIWIDNRNFFGALENRR